MLELIRKQLSVQIVLICFILLSIWWIILQFMGLPNDSNHNQLFAAVYGLIALWGGIYGFIIAQKWGGIHSIIGKSLLFFTAGLLFQEIGQLSYSYYIYFLRIPVPYPSVGDLFFYGTILFYIIAVIYLAQAAGIHISLRSFKSKIQAVIIPSIILLFSYFVFLQEYEFDWSNSLKVFLDFGVPFGQAFYISLAILTFTLTKNFLGGIMKSSVLLILFGLLAQYIADWTFLYQASRGIWYAGGINDYMYLCAYFVMTLALLQFNSAFKKLHSNDKKVV